MKTIDADRASGIVFLMIAAAFGFPTFSLGLGTPLRLGAGAFPLAVSALLALVGAGLILKSLRTKQDMPVLPFDFRAMLAVVASLLFAAFTLRKVGIAIAVPGAVLIASLGARSPNFKAILVASICLVAFAWLVFVAGLGIRLPLIAGIV